MIWPTHTEIGWSLIILAAVGGFGLIAHHIHERLPKLRSLGHRRKRASLDSSSSANFSSAIASLTELGWTVKPSSEAIQFELRGGSLPPMKESSEHFSHLAKPFWINFQAVENLKGFHYLSSVPDCTKIEISSGRFTDISELRGFSDLRRLSISQLPLPGVEIVDASALASLRDIKELNVYHTRIRDLSFLSALIHLEELSINGTLVTDVTPAAGLPFLKKLDIRDSRITNLQPLAVNYALSDLTIDGKQLTQLANLAKLPRLKTIMLFEQQEIDLSPLTSIVDLKNLSILGPSTKIDISPLRKLDNLKTFQLLSTGFQTLAQVADLGAISDMANLQTLMVSQNIIDDLSFMSIICELSEIHIGQIPISSVEPLRGLKNLRKLTLVQTSWSISHHFWTFQSSVNLRLVSHRRDLTCLPS